MQLRHSALTDANIMIFSDSPPRLQKIALVRSLAAIAANYSPNAGIVNNYCYICIS